MAFNSTYKHQLVSRPKFVWILLPSILLCILFSSGQFQDKALDSAYVVHTVDLTKSDIQFYWKDSQGKPIGSLANLKAFCQSNNQELVFAMNGGMYLTDQSPQGLYVENNKLLKSLDTSTGYGNFYLKPNGVFYLLNDKSAHIVSTENYQHSGKVKFATQSGPMLVRDGQLHPAFKKGSANVHIRNGVGILTNHKIVFAMSKTEVNFYDFASFFKELGCVNALYLDGFVSRTYLPAKNWVQKDGAFGVLIAEVKGK
jgi:uncharacterized protein YigE (DUF2233 family)